MGRAADLREFPCGLEFESGAGVPRKAHLCSGASREHKVLIRAGTELTRIPDQGWLLLVEQG